MIEFYGLDERDEYFGKAYVVGVRRLPSKGCIDEDIVRY